ncbi:MAG: tetratricopeptide repeat protein [Pirellulaceae bacterium]
MLHRVIWRRSRKVAALAEAYRLRLEMLGPKHPDTLASQSALGEVHTWVGQFDEAEKILTQTLTDQTELSGPESEDVLKTASRLAGVYGQTGRFDFASSMIEGRDRWFQGCKASRRRCSADAGDAVDTSRIVERDGAVQRIIAVGSGGAMPQRGNLGASHLLTIESLDACRATNVFSVNRVDEAISVYNDTLQRIVTTLGDQHPYVSVVRNDLAMIEYDTGDPKAALQTLQELEALSTQRYGPKHRETLISRLNRGNALIELGRFEEARDLFQVSLADSIESLGPTSAVTQKARVLLSSVLLDFDDVEGAQSLLNEVVDQQGDASRRASVDVLDAKGLLASIDLREERYLEAIERFEAVQQGYTKLRMQRTNECLRAIDQLIDAIIYSEQTEKLESLLDEIGETYGNDDPVANRFMLRIAENHVEMGQRAAAEKYIDRVTQWYRSQSSHRRETLDVGSYLALVLCQQERYKEAIPIYEGLIVHETELLGVDHVQRLSTMHDLAFAYGQIGSHKEAMNLYEEVVRRRSTVYGDEGEYTLVSLENLAGQQMLVENYRGAVDSLKRLAKARTAQGVGKVDLIEVHYSLAQALRLTGNYSEAAQYYKATLDGETQSLGPEHVDTLLTMHNWAYSLDNADEDAEAIAAYKEVVAGRTRTLGGTHPHTLLSLGNLVLLQASQADSEATIASIEDLLRRIEMLEPTAVEAIDSRYTIAEAYRMIKRYDEAIENYRKVADRREETLGPLHEQTLLALHQVAYASSLAGQKQTAVEVYADVVAGRSKTFGPAHRYTLLSLKNAGLIEFGRGRFAEADAIYQDMLDRVVRAKGERHLDTVEAKTQLAGTKMMLNRYEEATDLFAQTVDLFRQMPRTTMTDDQKRTFGYALIFLGNAEVHYGQEVAAKRHVDEGLDMLKVVAPQDVMVGVAMSVIGQLQTSDGQLEKAKASLTQAWKILSEANIGDTDSAGPQALLETMDRLVDLYRKLGNEEEAAKWIEKREAEAKRRNQNDASPN